MYKGPYSLEGILDFSTSNSEDFSSLYEDDYPQDLIFHPKPFDYLLDNPSRHELGYTSNFAHSQKNPHNLNRESFSIKSSRLVSDSRDSPAVNRTHSLRKAPFRDSTECFISDVPRSSKSKKGCRYPSKSSLAKSDLARPLLDSSYKKPQRLRSPHVGSNSNIQESADKTSHPTGCSFGLDSRGQYADPMVQMVQFPSTQVTSAMGVFSASSPTMMLPMKLIYDPNIPSQPCGLMDAEHERDNSLRKKKRCESNQKINANSSKEVSSRHRKYSKSSQGFSSDIPSQILLDLHREISTFRNEFNTALKRSKVNSKKKLERKHSFTPENNDYPTLVRGDPQMIIRNNFSSQAHHQTVEDIGLLKSQWEKELLNKMHCIFDLISEEETSRRLIEIQERNFFQEIFLSCMKRHAIEVSVYRAQLLQMQYKSYSHKEKLEILASERHESLQSQLRLLQNGIEGQSGTILVGLQELVDGITTMLSSRLTPLQSISEKVSLVEKSNDMIASLKSDMSNIAHCIEHCHSFSERLIGENLNMVCKSIFDNYRSHTDTEREEFFSRWVQTQLPEVLTPVFKEITQKNYITQSSSESKFDQEVILTTLKEGFESCQMDESWKDKVFSVLANIEKTSHHFESMESRIIQTIKSGLKAKGEQELSSLMDSLSTLISKSSVFDSFVDKSCTGYLSSTVRVPTDHIVRPQLEKLASVWYTNLIDIFSGCIDQKIELMGSILSERIYLRDNKHTRSIPFSESKPKSIDDSNSLQENKNYSYFDDVNEDDSKTPSSNNPSPLTPVRVNDDKEHKTPKRREIKQASPEEDFFALTPSPSNCNIVDVKASKETPYNSWDELSDDMEKIESCLDTKITDALQESPTKSSSPLPRANVLVTQKIHTLDLQTHQVTSPKVKGTLNLKSSVKISYDKISANPSPNPNSKDLPTKSGNQIKNLPEKLKLTKLHSTMLSDIHSIPKIQHPPNKEDLLLSSTREKKSLTPMTDATESGISGSKLDRRINFKNRVQYRGEQGGTNPNHHENNVNQPSQRQLNLHNDSMSTRTREQSIPQKQTGSSNSPPSPGNLKRGHIVTFSGI